MRNIAILAMALTGLSACDPATVTRSPDTVDTPEISCATRPGCAFDQTPLRVLPEPVTLPNRPYRFFPIASTLKFIDAEGEVWTAPERTLTDGASIPRIFVSIVGDPTSPEFINAAAVHDAYCGVGNEGGAMFQRAHWQDVHIMFYDGLVAGGTNPVTAKIMFAAVWLGGPRWADPRGGTVSTQGVAPAGNGGFINPLDRLPEWRLKQAMLQTKRHIEGTNPNLPQLVDYLWWLQGEMLREDPGDEFAERGAGEGIGEPTGTPVDAAAQ